MNDIKYLFGRYTDVLREKKLEHEAAKWKYFALMDQDYENPERCKELERRYEETKKDYELYAKLLSEFVLKNMDHITIQ